MINDETGESLFYPKNSQLSTSEFIVQQQSANTFVRPQEQMKSHVQVDNDLFYQALQETVTKKRSELANK